MISSRCASAAWNSPRPTCSSAASENRNRASGVACAKLGLAQWRHCREQPLIDPPPGNRRDPQAQAARRALQRTLAREPHTYPAAADPQQYTNPSRAPSSLP
ncbi:MAG TPA: hypothetical protein VGM21_13000 [Actinomycetota bacterium]